MRHKIFKFPVKPKFIPSEEVFGELDQRVCKINQQIGVFFIFPEDHAFFVSNKLFFGRHLNESIYRLNNTFFVKIDSVFAKQFDVVRKSIHGGNTHTSDLYYTLHS